MLNIGEFARLGQVSPRMLRHYDESGLLMPSLDVAIKTTEPTRIAEATATAPGFGHDNLNPVFQRLVPEVLEHLERSGAQPGIMIAWYEEPADDGAVAVHAGFDIADQKIP